jgi:hypothetical protein
MYKLNSETGKRSAVKRLVIFFLFHVVDPVILICFGWECVKIQDGWVWLDPETGEYLPQPSAITVCEGRIR